MGSILIKSSRRLANRPRGILTDNRAYNPVWPVWTVWDVKFTTRNWIFSIYFCLAGDSIAISAVVDFPVQMASRQMRRVSRTPPLRPLSRIFAGYLPGCATLSSIGISCTRSLSQSHRGKNQNSYRVFRRSLKGLKISILSSRPKSLILVFLPKMVNFQGKTAGGEISLLNTCRNLRTVSHSRKFYIETSKI